MNSQQLKGSENELIMEIAICHAFPILVITA